MKKIIDNKVDIKRISNKENKVDILIADLLIICGIVGIIQNQSIMLLTNHLFLNRFRLINHLQYLIQIESFY